MDDKVKDANKTRKVGIYDRPESKVTGKSSGQRLAIAIPIVIVLLLILYFLFAG